IVSTIVGEEISEKDALNFASSVVDRFSNPFLNHQWLSISLNYTSKMEMRNAALIEGFYQKHQSVPQHMALGFAAYLRFMKCEKNENGDYVGRIGSTSYTLNDEDAPVF